jgi:hypothetical protein
MEAFSIHIPGKGHPVRKARRKLRTPTADEVSAHMRSLAKARWKGYADRVARGEINKENYVYRPRGPMPSHSKAQQNLTRWERQIANARLLRFALEGRKLSVRQIERMTETTLSRKSSKPHLRFGGQPPKQWHSVHYRLSSKGQQSISVPNEG